MSLNYENVGKEVIYNRSVDNIEDYVKGTIVGCYIGEDEEYYVTSIESSGECIKVYDDSLLEIISSGSGGDVTADAVATAIGDMTEEQSAQALSDLGGEPEKMVVTVTDDGQGGYTADKTFAEIKAAYDSGKDIVAEMSDAIFRLYQYQYGTDPFFGTSGVASFFNDSAIMGLYEIQISYVNQNDRVDVIQEYYAPRTNVEDVDGTTVSITPFANTVYNCTASALTSLTITDPGNIKYSVIFYSGATATTTVGISNFVAEANKRYKIVVEDGYATYDSWPYTPTP